MLARMNGHALPKAFTMRSMAARVFSWVLNAVRRKYPSPAGPNPEPGVPATPALSSSWSKNSHEVVSPGVFSHTYGASTPP